MRYFVSGIGTGVGKTVTSALLCKALNADYWKPVQTGSIEGTDSDIIKKLISGKIFSESYCFKEPLSPHAAAELENEKIDPSKILLDYKNFNVDKNLIIEGAGGLMVPLNEKYLILDLIEELKAPVILVTRHYLGSINHTLMSMEILKQRNIPVHSLIINGPSNKLTEKIYSGLGIPEIRIPDFNFENKSELENISMTLKNYFEN